MGLKKRKEEEKNPTYSMYVNVYIHVLYVKIYCSSWCEPAGCVDCAIISNYMDVLPLAF